MTDKEKYHSALIQNNGRINEIDLGKTIGLDEEQTTKIIAALLSDYRIEYVTNGVCGYSSMKKRKQKKNCT